MSTWLDDYPSKMQVVNNAIEDAINSCFTEELRTALANESREAVVAKLISKVSEEINERDDYQALLVELNEAVESSQVPAVSVLSILVGQFTGVISCAASLTCKFVELVGDSDQARRTNAGKGGANSAKITAEQFEGRVKPEMDKLVDIGLSVSEAARRTTAKLRTGQLIPGEHLQIDEETIRKRYGNSSKP